jgi:hypothetical protein
MPAGPKAEIVFSRGFLPSALSYFLIDQIGKSLCPRGIGGLQKNIMFSDS